MVNLLFYIVDVFAEAKYGRIRVFVGGRAVTAAKGEFTGGDS